MKSFCARRFWNQAHKPMIHEKQLELFPFRKLCKQQRLYQSGLEETHHTTSTQPLSPPPFSFLNLLSFSNRELGFCLYVFETYQPLTMINRALPHTKHLFSPPHAHISSIQTIWRDRMFKFKKNHSLEGTEKGIFSKSIVRSWKTIQTARLVAHISCPSVASHPYWAVIIWDCWNLSEFS